MKLSKTTVAGLALVAICFIGGKIADLPVFSGSPAEIEILGTSIRPGETTVNDLAAGGFDLTDL